MNGFLTASMLVSAAVSTSITSVSGYGPQPGCEKNWLSRYDGFDVVFDEEIT